LRVIPDATLSLHAHGPAAGFAWAQFPESDCRGFSGLWAKAIRTIMPSLWRFMMRKACGDKI
jgi:hypothetical protein